ncbi:hypothetical protein JCM19239_4821 [Vibrio variabilis]|uniref:Uncharacterized protein n=1 Tax=Vibrio variabilis TaxID=990271 RepID=A0ABQ0JGG7_9VIBR|nr:hypothetical protein JCM19239_4821 [Vibrio variabilis]
MVWVICKGRRKTVKLLRKAVIAFNSKPIGGTIIGGNVCKVDETALTTSELR